MEITLYTIHCPSCKVLEMKLSKSGLNYNVVDDEEEVVKVGREHGIASAPILKVDDNYFKLSDANKWLKEQV